MKRLPANGLHKSLAIILFCSLSLTGCYWIYGGEAVLDKEMLRPADGKKIWCDSGVFASGGLFDGEKNARRFLNACILACRQHGFVEVGQPTVIDEANSKLKPEEGSGNTPDACLDR